jgi:hypothetical protein
MMCALMGVTRGGYYGSPRVTGQLRRNGVHVGRR